MKVIAYYPLFGGRSKKHLSQAEAVARLIKKKKYELVAQFHEGEPGLGELRLAMAKAVATGATLLFSHIGYLSKNLKFLRAIAEGGADLRFLAIDDRSFNPTTFKHYLGLAHDAWHERRKMIRQGMAEAKSQGAKFGMARRGAKTKNWRKAKGWQAAAEASVAARSERVADAYALLIPKMLEMQEKGEGPTAIALALNEEGHVTTTGAPFSAPTVFRILKRHARHGGRHDRARGKGLGRTGHDAAAVG